LSSTGTQDTAASYNEYEGRAKNSVYVLDNFQIKQASKIFTILCLPLKNNKTITIFSYGMLAYSSIFNDGSILLLSEAYSELLINGRKAAQGEPQILGVGFTLPQ
jgi:hypothetical protein